jgi:hypothetical protein
MWAMDISSIPGQAQTMPFGMVLLRLAGGEPI